MRATAAAALAALAMAAPAAAAPTHTSSHSCWVGSGYGGWVAASSRTSCPFALRVVHQADKAVWRWGYGYYSVNAWSPVTGRWYYMHCHTARTGYSSCAGGTGSRVTWWVP